MQFSPAHLLSAVVTVLCLAGSAFAADKPKAENLNTPGFGSVSGQFVLDGGIPVLKPLVTKGDPAAKDAAVCAVKGVVNDRMVIDPKTRGIRHIFVYIRKIDAATVHPKLKKSKRGPVVFDQKGCIFKPHTLVMRTDQSVLVKSGDNCSHNTHTFPIRNRADNFTIAANNRTGVKYKLPVAEFLPTTVKCDIHPWMRAYWLVLDHPYAAITDATGKFTIAGLPAGVELEFRCWQELIGYVAAGTKRGFTVTIVSGKTTTLPPVKVPVGKFDLNF